VKTIRFFPEAQAEYDDALVASPDAGEFQRVIDKALQDITTGLMTHPRVRKTPARLCGFSTLPYSIVYIETDAEIGVVALQHNRRRPNYWKSRLRPRP